MDTERPIGLYIFALAASIALLTRLSLPNPPTTMDVVFAVIVGTAAWGAGGLLIHFIGDFIYEVAVPQFGSGASELKSSTNITHKPAPLPESPPPYLLDRNNRLFFNGNMVLLTEQDQKNFPAALRSGFKIVDPDLRTKLVKVKILDQDTGELTESGKKAFLNTSA